MTMTAQLTFISAGAGSGKTHRLTRILHQELAARRVAASGVIATTFTRKAATELRERVREFLLGEGEHDLANAMGQARIGTVNAVCGELVRRFAFEAGLPTEQTVLEEEQATLLLRQAIDMVQDGTAAAELLALRKRLAIADEDWNKSFRDLVAAVRANAIAPADLQKIAAENADDLLSYFPQPTTDDLTAMLAAELDSALPPIQAAAGSVTTTATYLDAAESVRRGLRHDDASWSGWIKLSKAQPAKGLVPLVQGIQAIAARTLEHPRLHSDLRDYLRCHFGLCAEVLDAYGRLKAERGVIDFTDQERLLLQLLDDPFVAQTLTEELDLLMVDEFQDTSPIQLALFLRLTQFAKQVYWVGDIKQAIYGFRGSDTELMGAIVAELGAMGGTKDRLDDSWRSRKPLVDLVNAVFVPAFSATLPPEDVVLHPQRTEAITGAPYGFWRLPGNATQQVTALGEALRQLVASGYVVHDKPENRLRPIRLGDIAILRRSNANVTATAMDLRAAGVPAMTAQPGLLATPEAVLALACLRRLNDPGDSLASAEIISLADCGEPEAWVSDRLEHLANDGDPATWREIGPDAHPLLSRLAELRQDMPVMAPAEALETAIASAGVPSLVLRWSGSSDIGRVRLANLDALVALARQYETICLGARHAASVSGLLLWLNEQASSEADSRALPAIDAVQVMTHHKAKGLEWPVVILMDTHGEVKDALWDSLRARSRQPISAADPLCDRTLRFWPWPFGQQKKIPFNDELAHRPIGQEFRQIAVEESKRILYVSMTRARDLMIFAVPDKKASGEWLETLGAPWLIPGTEDLQIHCPTGEAIPVLPMCDAPPYPAPVEQPLWWYRDPGQLQRRLPLTFNPSKAASPQMQIVESVSIGERLSLAAAADWTTIGHAVHAAMALAFIDLAREITRGDVEAILSGYELSQYVSAETLTAQVAAVVKWVGTRWPSARPLPEWPIEAILSSDQVLTGRIDLLLDDGGQWILIDHKSNPGGRGSWPDLANEYGGQLLAYQGAIEQISGKRVSEMWLVLPVAGGAIRIERV